MTLCSSTLLLQLPIHLPSFFTLGLYLRKPGVHKSSSLQCVLY
jgi:hypothetical protein